MIRSLAKDIARRAQARWPNLAFDEEAVAGALARHYPSGNPPGGFAAEDFALAAAAAAGDREAWGVFFEEHRAFIFRVARNVLKNENDAEELAQDLSGADAPQRLRLYAGRCSLRGWLAGVVRRLAVNLIRERRRSVRASDLQPDEDKPRELRPAAETLRHAMTPAIEALDRRLCDSAIRESLHYAWSRLERKERELLEYKHVRGLKNREIARIWGVKEYVISKRLDKAVGRLGKGLRRYASLRFNFGESELRQALELVEGAIEIGLFPDRAAADG